MQICFLLSLFALFLSFKKKDTSDSVALTLTSIWHNNLESFNATVFFSVVLLILNNKKSEKSGGLMKKKKIDSKLCKSIVTKL